MWERVSAAGSQSWRLAAPSCAPYHNGVYGDRPHRNPSRAPDISPIPCQSRAGKMQTVARRLQKEQSTRLARSLRSSRLDFPQGLDEVSWCAELGVRRLVSQLALPWSGKKQSVLPAGKRFFAHQEQPTTARPDPCTPSSRQGPRLLAALAEHTRVGLLLLRTRGWK